MVSTWVLVYQSGYAVEAIGVYGTADEAKAAAKWGDTPSGPANWRRSFNGQWIGRPSFPVHRYEVFRVMPVGTLSPEQEAGVRDDIRSQSLSNAKNDG